MIDKPCETCLYLKKRWGEAGSRVYECWYPAWFGDLSPVTGKRQFGPPHDCFILRMEKGGMITAGECGPEGKLWVGRP